MHCFPGATGFDKGHQLSLVVRRSTAPDHLAVWRILDLRVERMLKQQNQLQQSFKRILEINPRHALITALAQSVGKEGAGEKVEEAARLLLDQARIIEGEQIPDPTAFSRRLNIVMASALPV